MNKSISKKLFWNIGTLIAFVFTLLLLIPQYFSHPKDIDWTSNEVTLIITINIVIFLLGTLVLNLIIELGNILDPTKGVIRQQIDEWRDDQKGNLAGIIDDRFKDTIKDFANAHKGFINGMYDNYPKDFMEIFVKEKVEGKNKKNGLAKLHESNTKRSLYVWMQNVGIDTYSDFADELLGLTHNSVFSTTYYDNSQFIDALGSNKKVKGWLDNVNKKNRIIVNEKKENNPNFNVFRVHMFKNKNGTKISSRDFDDFIDSIKENTDAKKNYEEKYLKPSDNFHTWHVDGEMFFYGEYIIFDEQIMIKYNEDFDILELYIGQIVMEHSKNFKVGGTYFELDKEGMLKKLNDK